MSSSLFTTALVTSGRKEAKVIGSSAAGTVRETMVQAVRAGSRSVRTAAVRRRVCRGVRFIVVVVVGAGARVGGYAR